MRPRDRKILVLLVFVSASAAAGCGGGGGGSASNPMPLSSALAVTTRPLQNGDAFAYAGTTTKTFVYSGTTPEPQATTVYAVTQNVKITGPTSYAGASNVFDVNAVETDVSALQSTGVTTDTYDAELTSGSSTNLVTYGFTSTDTSGESLAVTLPSVNSGNGLLDELPEKAGARWTNGPAQSLTESSPGGLTSTRSTAADGSYVDTTNFPIGSIYASPVPGAPLVSSATITQRGDGSGSYVFYGIVATGGSPQNIEELDFATPAPAASGGPSTIAISQPQPTGSPALVVTIPLWYPQPLKLYDETDEDQGSVTIPAACNVAASIATTANALVQTIVSYDTIVGTQENFTQTSYVIPNDGVACVGLNETLLYYYDYSGQSNVEQLVPNANVTGTATLPIETETIATTIGLTQASVQAASTGLRVAAARSDFRALVEREKTKRKRLLLQRLARALAATGPHR
jgi:hypothetical protein